ncbi:hypothetical protein ACHAXA_007182 [Cyclostephanos tholiformis]|uniref:Cytidyltransferase-like domain-containing protein n=1 Tax=Cyclostephanos tholiformis TaxID=382380 RepID=A0ABD3RCR9_9STRA
MSPSSPAKRQSKPTFSANSTVKREVARLTAVTVAILLNVVIASTAAAAAVARTPPPRAAVALARTGSVDNRYAVTAFRHRGSSSRNYRSSSHHPSGLRRLASSPPPPRSRALGSSSSRYHSHFATDARSFRIGDRCNRDRVKTRMTRTMTSSSSERDDVGGSGIDQQTLANVLAMRLVRGGITTLRDGVTNVPPPPHHTDDDGGGIRACIAVAGGGSHATSAILSVPGASSVLLESVVVYDRLSFAEYVSRNGGGDTRWVGGGIYSPPAKYGVDASFAISDDGKEEDEEVKRMTTTNDDDIDEGVEASELPSSASSSSSFASFRFCSIEAAILLSQSALGRSLHLSPSVNDRILRCMGVGCTSSLVGSSGRRGRRSRAYVACSTPVDGTLVWELILADNNDYGDEDGKRMVMEENWDARQRRSRMEEERVVSNAVLLAMLHCQQRRRSRATLRERIVYGDDDDDDISGLWGEILDREGDIITERKMDPRGDVSVVDCEGTDPRWVRTGWVVTGNSAAWGASRIIDGQANVVAILPVVAGTGLSRVIRMEALLSDDDIPLPYDVLIVPGSFNPPHVGHVGLANAAVTSLRRLRRMEMEEGSGDGSSGGHRFHAPSSSSSASSSVSSSILRSMWDAVDGHTDGQYDPAVLFEMSVTNADKPPLDPMEVQRRVDLFASPPLLSSEMPKDWGVILTNAPLFSQKSGVLDGLIANYDDVTCGDFPLSRSTNLNRARGRRRRKMSFVLGTDTLLRIIDPKYYGNSMGDMISALLCMKERGVHFIVGGRLEQGTKKSTSITFVNGEEQVMSLPQDVQDMFTLLSEDEFRLDISSTELRKKVGI